MPVRERQVARVSALVAPVPVRPVPDNDSLEYCLAVAPVAERVPQWLAVEVELAAEVDPLLGPRSVTATIGGIVGMSWVEGQQFVVPACNTSLTDC